ncbi:DUF1510 family protein [bacterium LRH843]|nr:DUF1510 family protein [bacterium LRH843]
MQGHRFEQRKKQRINRILNAAIGIVVILILVFGAKIFLGSSSKEQTLVEIEETPVEEQDQNTVPDPIEKQNQTVENKDKTDQHEEDIDEVDVNEVDVDEEMLPVPDGEWEPVGTVQTGEFSHDFSKSGTNWNEMAQALRYATGLDENMIIWRLENGGSPIRARGVVSAPDSQDYPYEVYIEFIEGHGWMPVEKQQLPSNPYRG